MNTAVFALAASCLGSASALGEPEATLYSEFQAICVAHPSDPAASLDAVNKLGWTQVPPEKLAGFSTPAVKLDHFKAYVKAANGTGSFLFAGEGAVFDDKLKQPVRVSMCGEMKNPADETSLEEARAWARVPAAQSGPAQEVYSFRDSPSGHVPVKQEGSAAAFRRGVGQALFIEHNADAKALVLLTPPKTRS